MCDVEREVTEGARGAVAWCRLGLGAAKRVGAWRDGAATCGVGRGAIAGCCIAGAGWNAGADGRAIAGALTCGAGAAGRATGAGAAGRAAGAAGRPGCCAAASMLPAIRKALLTATTTGSANRNCLGSMGQSSLSSICPISRTRECAKRSAVRRPCSAHRDVVPSNLMIAPSPASKERTLDHDAIEWNRIMISSLCSSMIFSESRFPLCANAALRVRIMLY